MPDRDHPPTAEPGTPQRFFVVNAGRTGSSLLCAILAGAGADFGVPADASWSADDGAFETPAVTRAAAWFGKARQLSVEKPPWPRRWLWDIARHRGKHHLKRALAAPFVKGPNLDLAIQPAVKLGYQPRIIVSYRSFPAQAMSLAQRSAHRDVTSLEAYYRRTYRNALMWLMLYGGCVIDYDELVDVRDVGWIAPLAAVTRLAPESIAAARQARSRPGAAVGRPLPVLSPECERLYDSLRALSGRVVPPSRVALRSLEKSAAA